MLNTVRANYYATTGSSYGNDCTSRYVAILKHLTQCLCQKMNKIGGSVYTRRFGNVTFLEDSYEGQNKKLTLHRFKIDQYGIQKVYILRQLMVFKVDASVVTGVSCTVFIPDIFCRIIFSPARQNLQFPPKRLPNCAQNLFFGRDSELQIYHGNFLFNGQ